MINIEWKGKIGYGDIVSPICYAHNVSYKLKTPVTLNFRWATDNITKIEPRDPETLWRRCNYIMSLCETKGTTVSMYHKFNDPITFNHSNYDWDVVGSDKFHNYWYPIKSARHERREKTIVVNTTTFNSMPLLNYGKAWKDPAVDDWRAIVEMISQKYKVVEVNYQTPIGELVNLLSRCVGFVGYHGTAAWVAKFTHTPSVIFSQGKSLTSNAFPYAFIESDPMKFLLIAEHIGKALESSKLMIEKVKDEYERLYFPSDAFVKHLTHETT